MLVSRSVSDHSLCLTSSIVMHHHPREKSCLSSGLALVAFHYFNVPVCQGRYVLAMIITRLLRALMRCIVSCQTFLPAKVLTYHPTLWIDFNFVVSHANSGSCSSANVVMTHRQLLEPRAVTYKSYADARAFTVSFELWQIFPFCDSFASR